MSIQFHHAIMKIPSFKTPAASTISIQAVTVVYLTRGKKTTYPGYQGGGTGS